MNINYLTKFQQDKLVNSLNSYYQNADLTDEYYETFSDVLNKFPDGILNLAYTTYGDDEQFAIQINFNLNKMRYEEYINDELFFKPNESYDRTFDQFCDEIESCDFESMIHNCAMECIDREDNPERMYTALRAHLEKYYGKDQAKIEFRKAMWYLLHNDSSIYDLYDFNNNYKKDIVDDYFAMNEDISNKMWTEYLSTLDSDIGGIKKFMESLEKDKDSKEREKDNFKAKGL